MEGGDNFGKFKFENIGENLGANNIHTSRNEDYDKQLIYRNPIFVADYAQQDEDNDINDLN